MPGKLRWIVYWVVVVAGVGFAASVVVDQRSDEAGRREPLAQVQPNDSPSASPSSPSGQASSAQWPAGTRVLFVGDGFLTRTGSFARLTCTRLSWKCKLDASVGSGYVAGRTYASRLSRDKAVRPDLVVVTGGRSDVGLDGVGRAARSYLKAVVRQFPDAAVVVVEPFWNDDVMYDSVDRLRGDIKAAAGQAGVRWVPSEGWLSGGGNFRSGGALPSAAGAQVLATKLEAALRSEPS